MEVMLFYHYSNCEPIILQSSDDSDYEDDGLTEEELKETEGYKLAMKCLDAMLRKPLN